MLKILRNIAYFLLMILPLLKAALFLYIAHMMLEYNLISEPVLNILKYIILICAVHEIVVFAYLDSRKKVKKI